MLSISLLAIPASGQAQQLELTAEEQAWLKQHPVIRIGIDAAYAPYSFTDKKNRFVGVAPDLLALLEKRLSIRFEPVAGLSWPEIVEGTRQRSLDVIATAVITEERKQFLNFSQIYIPTPLVIMTRQVIRIFNTPPILTGIRSRWLKAILPANRCSPNILPLSH